MKLNNLSHSDVDIAVVEIAVKSVFNVGFFKESFKSLIFLIPRIVDFSSK